MGLAIGAVTAVLARQRASTSRRREGSRLLYMMLSMVCSLALSACGSGSEIDDKTSCNYAITAFNTENRESVSAVVRYIHQVLESIDEAKISDGQASLLRPLTQDGLSGLETAAVQFCRNDRYLTIHEAASKTYDGFRAARTDLVGQ